MSKCNVLNCKDEPGEYGLCERHLGIAVCPMCGGQLKLEFNKGSVDESITTCSYKCSARYALRVEDCSMSDILKAVNSSERKFLKLPIIGQKFWDLKFNSILEDLSNIKYSRKADSMAITAKLMYIVETTSGIDFVPAPFSLDKGLVEWTLDNLLDFMYIQED